jgi:ubiquinone/menaquinone biosynthesis C-methylase UbiE
MEAQSAHWDEVWSDTQVLMPHDTVLTAVSRLNVSTALEVGAGSGRDLEEMMRAGTAVTYTDFSEIATASFKRRNAGCAALTADARSLPFPDNHFDLVMSLGLIEHFEREQRAAILSEKFRVSRRYVLVDVPQKFAPAFLVKRGMMRVGRWRYGEETEFSFNALVREVKRVAPAAAVSCSYGREIVPLPRNLKQHVYRRLPPTVKGAFISSHFLLGRGMAGSVGIVFEKLQS